MSLDASEVGCVVGTLWVTHGETTQARSRRARVCPCSSVFGPEYVLNVTYVGEYWKSFDVSEIIYLRIHHLEGHRIEREP